MVLSSFRKLVFASAAKEGVPYLSETDVADLNDLIWRRLNVYCSFTQCLQSDSVAFTPIVGQRAYQTLNPDTQDGTQLDSGNSTVTYLASPMCNIEQVFISGSPLTVAGSQGCRYGESSEGEVRRNSPGYLTAGNNKPVFFFQKAPNWLYFNCPFDQAYTNCFVSGRKYHTPLTLANGGDNQVLDLAPEDLDLAAEDATIALLRPYNRELAVTLAQELRPRLEARKGSLTTKTSGHGPRSSGRTETLDLMG